jgi:hypothetical protein
MADQLYLSYWLNGFTAQNMSRHYEKMLRLFPYSRLMFGASVFRIIPIAYSEPAIAEQALAMPDGIERVLTLMKEFHSADCSYRMETSWDLWQFEGSEWKIAPAKAALSCFGPEFQDSEAQLDVEFGIDALFLPQPGLPNAAQMAQFNVKSLLKLVHDLDNALNVDRRRLWSESGENFSERLQTALLEAS